MASDRLTDPAAKAAPSAATRPVEAIMARHIIFRAVFVAPIFVVVFWLVRGPQGAIAAAIGIAVVLANFWLGGWILSAAARVSLSLYHAAALIGFFVRLGLITGSMFAIASLFDIDRIAFGITAVGSYVVLLTLEAGAVLRGARREFEWTS
jgi:hypothetical protein